MNEYLDKGALTQIVNLLEQQFGTSCEVVLHDLSLPYESTIVDIRNGHITNRRIGDCGSNLGLEVIRGTVENGDKYNYYTTTKDGRILRSSSIYLKDQTKKMRYALCVNMDITDSVKFEAYLHNQNRFDLSKDLGSANGDEVFVSDVHELVQSMIDRGIAFIGKPVEEMGRADKARLVGFLDRKGMFLITRSSERVCDALGLTKYAFYQMLDAARKNSNGNSYEPVQIVEADEVI